MSNVFAALMLGLLAAGSDGPPPSGVDFGRDIRPILARSCLKCHGAKKQQGGLSLVDGASALAGGDGGAAVVPGKPDASRLYRYVAGLEDDDRMPPESEGDALPPDQVEKIRLWISQGAHWPDDRAGAGPAPARSDHWAFRRPQSPAVPAVGDRSWPLNPIDHFVLQRLEREGLKPSTPADRPTLIRRLSLDLIGLPPTPAEVDAFLADDRPDAYERVVDRLLASPHYGERWARRWLDAARYADTNGYEKDRDRSIWPYRDWVIRALNDDMPFDAFTVKQLAGDLLPGATTDDKVATGFHRNTMINEEGGIDVEEFRFASVVDRVATTGTVWLGLTLQCAQCHTHKFDPITQREYYRFFAYFNNADEPELDLPDPAIAAQRSRVAAEIRELEGGLAAKFCERVDLGLSPDHGSGEPPIPTEERRREQLTTRLAEWVAGLNLHRWDPVAPLATTSAKNATMNVLADASVLVTGDKPNNDTYRVELPVDRGGISALRLEVLPDTSLPAGGPGRAPLFSVGDFLLDEFEVGFAAPGGATIRPVALGEATQDYASANRSAALALDGKSDTGWQVQGRTGEPHAAVFAFKAPLAESAGRLVVTLHQRYIHQMTIGRFRFSTTTDAAPVRASGLPADVEAIALLPSGDRTAEQADALERRFLLTTPELKAEQAAIAKVRKSMPSLTTTMVMSERATKDARTTQVHRRGEFLRPAEAVEAGTPAVLHPIAADGGGDRLALARWLVAPENPLVGRVVMNRTWQAFFGRGLVGTVEDFGVRGEQPTHPELLDWLATEFPRRGWCQKAMHRLIVTSRTYRQDSRTTPDATARDPRNELLARGPRFRVDAEVIRDIALSASGLLEPKIGGPSVYPPQPDGVTTVAYGQPSWPTSTGRDRFRRGLYTYIKRSAPFAAFTTLDVPTSELTCVRRERSNTPLQALTLLNDLVFVEAARALALRIVTEGPSDPAGRARWAFRLVLTRSPTDDECTALVKFQSDQANRFRAGELDSTKFMGPGVEVADATSRADQAAWAATARVLLNLDETITKE